MEPLLETTKFLETKIICKPKIAIILGTGLGELVNHVEILQTIPYGSIPNFPISTVESHKGKLIIGKLSGKEVLIMQGRFHYYEGYTMEQVTFPVRVMKMLGIETLLVSNASGGLQEYMEVSDLLIITDHINLLPENPLRGNPYPKLGPMFPDMSEVYDPKLIEEAEKIAQQAGIRYHKGVYVSVQGPNLETKAEYKFLRVIGGDVVGMSTVPEIIVAKHQGMRCFAISVITDVGHENKIRKVEISDVIAAAHKAQPAMIQIFSELVKVC
ncbi:MAG: purine-nucleoside phosphorylase [Raineya sp.]|nr:purine-nucleoside phosphorylase [Raineya sp.]MDW8296577.1 purine-nucleoside phosphorylase [Raineya sp.]